MVTGFFACPFEKPPVGNVLLLLVGQWHSILKQKLRAHEPDAVADGAIDPVDFFKRATLIRSSICTPSFERAGLRRKAFSQVFC